jgi:hypothetical protein
MVPAASFSQRHGVSSPSWYQLLTIAAALADVASVMIGGTLGLAVRHGAVRRGETWTASHNPAWGLPHWALWRA